MTCDACGREAATVHAQASYLGPMTFAYCDECNYHQAEPYDVVVEMVNSGSIKAFLHNVTVYRDGKYVTMDELEKAGVFAPLGGGS